MDQNIPRLAIKRPKTQFQFDTGRRKKKSIALPMPWPSRSAKNFLIGIPRCSQAAAQAVHYNTNYSSPIISARLAKYNRKGERIFPPDLRIWYNRLTHQYTQSSPTDKPISINSQVWSSQKAVILTITMAEGGHPRSGWIQVIELLHIYSITDLWYDEHRLSELRWGFHCFSPHFSSNPHLLRTL